ncbi:MAG: ribosome biogenesis GTPase Der [Patescibacteria group bacterium]|nr:ribosome biogenesis GTPase Der [Patescibacteria group bacterium]
MLRDNLPLIVIIGRTNVGKSTLFNRLIEVSQAIVSPIENTTRDFNINTMNWRGLNFQLIDTAGVLGVENLKRKINQDSSGIERIEQKVQQQVYELINKADLLFFVVDNKAGLLPEDKEIVKFIKKRDYQKKTILVVNKVDSFKQRFEASEFNKLSLGDPILISATTGSGLGDLLDLVVDFIKKNKKKWKNKTLESSMEKINLCIIGKPNVGKSSLLNSLSGYERAIVSEVPHTTREPQNTEIIYNNKIINIIDTAGISKRGQKTKGLEKYGIIKSRQTLKKADIVLLLIDINEEITKQDSKLVEEIVDLGKSFIVVANKWDLVEDRDTKKWTRHINVHFPFILWAPILFISALTGEKTKKIFDLVLKIDESRKKKINETALSRFLIKMIKIHKPSKGKGVKHPRVYSLRQFWVNPPRFEIKIGSQEDLHKSYLRFLENRIRENFGFFGTPVKVTIKKNKKIHGKKEGE